MATTMGAGGVQGEAGDEPRIERRPQGATAVARAGIGSIGCAGLASVGAGAVHAVAAGIHAESVDLARIFVVLAMLQIGVGVVAIARPTTRSALALIVVNVGAVVGWIVTRVASIDWISGLENAEAPQFTDTVCALLGLLAVGLGIGAIASRRVATTLFSLGASSLVVVGLVVPAMLLGASHVHSHGGDATTTAAHDDGHEHDDSGAEIVASGADVGASGDEAAAAAATEHDADGHAHDTTSETVTDTATDTETDTDTATAAGHDAADGHHDGDVVLASWPRPWDPAQPIDVSGVEGVTAAQQLRATKLIEDTLRELPKYADPAAAIAAGYESIGDGGTGTEHFIKGDLIEDDALLDATGPESLVYEVADGVRTLTGAMYIASARPADDPTLTEWAGPLMTWHKHDNLCWSLNDVGEAVIVGIIDGEGTCANGVRAGGENPMVHVWIEPHPCGVFAALDGIGAGTAAVSEAERVDMCSGEHDHGGGAGDGDPSGAPAAIAKPYDPTMPIDLSGTPGVTPQQQAAAENLIAVNLAGLPQWGDFNDAEAAGFRSIGDGSTGHEHFIQWDWINDDIALDPDFPESLVYQPQPDGSKKLVSAMYMLPRDVPLDEVPDIGGPLMQWHIHDDLCFTNDPDAPKVAGVTSPNGTCPTGLEKFQPAPMIHVWITAHKCGPFAALEGVGAGQIADGEERLCDHAHGKGF